MKTVSIYHSIDLDGWMSAAIVKHWWINKHKNSYIQTNKNQYTAQNGCDSIDFIGYNHYQPIPDLSTYDEIIMCDISFSAEEMKKISSKTIWIDHHISSILDWQNVELSDLDNKIYQLEGIRDTKFAACELTWMYLFPNETIPEIVRLLGLYDSFRHKCTDDEEKVLEFQYGARSIIKNYEDAYDYLNIEYRKYGEYNQEINKRISDKGLSIYQYLCTDAIHIYNTGFEIILQEPYVGQWGSGKENRKFICINNERFNPSNFGINYHDDGYDGCACFYYDNGMWNFSIYNANGLVDCSLIAKQYGGGGHMGASGMMLNTEQFLKLINSKNV